MARRERLLGALLVLSVLACRPSGEDHLRKANVYFKNGSLAEAEKHYGEAAKLNNPAGEEGLGNVFYEKKDYAKAIAHYKRAIKLDARAIGARHKLAVALSTTGRHKEAIEALKETIALEPRDAFALNAIGGLYAKLGDTKQAEAFQIKALEADEGYHAARYALANILVESGRTEEAERQFTLLSQKGARSIAEYGFARIAATRGRFDEVANHLQVVLSDKVARPEKILTDRLFEKGWSHPQMKEVQRKLQAMTSSASKSKDG